VLSDVEFSWEESTDLIHWTSAEKLPTAPPAAEEGFWKTETALFPAGIGSYKFLRLLAKQGL